MRNHHFLFYFLIGCFASCSPKDDEISKFAAENKLFQFEVSMEREMNLFNSAEKGQPLTSKVSEVENNLHDLFALQIFDEDGYPYAYVVGDDISKIILNLVEGHVYEFQATYIRNGKNIVQKIQDTYSEYGLPLSTYQSGPTELNKIYYGADNHLAYLGWYKITGEGPLVNQLHTAVDRYYNVIEFEATQDNREIELNLKRVSIAINLEVDLGEETELEQLIFTPEGSNSYVIDLKEGKGTLQIPFLTLPGDEGLRAMDEIIKPNHLEDFTFSIGTEQNPHRFYAGSIEVRRNTEYNLKAIYHFPENKIGMDFLPGHQHNINIELRNTDF